MNGIDSLKDRAFGLAGNQINLQIPTKGTDLIGWFRKVLSRTTSTSELQFSSVIPCLPGPGKTYLLTLSLAVSYSCTTPYFAPIRSSNPGPMICIMRGSEACRRHRNYAKICLELRTVQTMSIVARRVNY